MRTTHRLRRLILQNKHNGFGWTERNNYQPVITVYAGALSTRFAGKGRHRRVDNIPAMVAAGQLQRVCDPGLFCKALVYGCLDPDFSPLAQNFVYVPLGCHDLSIDPSFFTGTIPSDTLPFTIPHEAGHLMVC